MNADFNKLNPDPSGDLATRVATALVNAGRHESLEAVVNAACDIVYTQWSEGHESGPSESASALQASEPLRTVSPAVAEAMAQKIREFRLATRDQYAGVFEALLEMRTNSLSRAGLSHSSAPGLAHLMATALGPSPIYLDPACGFGGTLLAAGRVEPGARLIGVDINAGAAQTAYRRLRLAGLEAEISVLDWFTVQPSPVWDAILVEPPFGLKMSQSGELRPGGDGDIGWLESVAASLSEAGRAVILLPDGVAFRGGPVSAARQRLLDGGLVEAIVAMPEGTVLGSAVPTCMWVLRGRGNSLRSGEVLLVNARSKSLTEKDWFVEVAETLAAWRSGGTLAGISSWFASPVRKSTLIESRDATPQRHLAPPPEAATPRPQAPGTLLTELRLESFKSVGAKVRVPLKPLTLVFGKNSAGKSSLIQSILLIKQSLRAGQLAPNGPLTDLGSIAGLAHNHVSNAPISVGFSFASSADIDSALLLPNPSQLRSVDFRISAAEERQDQDRLELLIALGQRGFRWQMANDDSTAFRLPADDLTSMVELAYSEDSVYPARKRSSGQPGATRSELRRLGIDSVDFAVEHLLVGPPAPKQLAEIRHRSSSSTRPGRLEGALRTVGNLFGAIGQELDALLARVAYLGPLRQPPARIATRSASDAGLDVPFFLLDNTSERAEVSDRLHQLGMPYDLDAVRVSSAVDPTLFGDLAALVLTDTRTGTRLSTADVGFGISQVLPIVTELSARTRSIVLIEQPEIHLHPAMQADLADLLIESVDPLGRANQVIAETHSENIMLRVQRRIREGSFNASDLAVLYVDQDSRGDALVRELRLDEEGDFIDAWPHGFFVERFEDIFGEAR